MEVSVQEIKTARKLFRNYNRIRMEVRQLENSIEFTRKNIEASIDSDIHSKSVSHGSGGTGGSSGGSSDKIPHIVENISNIRKQYEANLCKLSRRKNLLEGAIKSIDIYVSSLEWSDKTLMVKHYINEIPKTYDEIAAEVYTSPETLKKREKKLLAAYVRLSHIDIKAVIEIM